VSVCHINPAFENPEEIRSADIEDPNAEGGSTRSASSIEDVDTAVQKARSPPRATRNGIESSPVYETKTVPKPAVVVVRNAHKSYSSGTPVLSDFNMTVEKGTM